MVLNRKHFVYDYLWWIRFACVNYLRDAIFPSIGGRAPVLELERFMHLYAMNRGILLTPFHNMALMSPQTHAEDVDRHTEVFREAVNELGA
jgi:hypothetical protein